MLIYLVSTATNHYCALLILMIISKYVKDFIAPCFGSQAFLTLESEAIHKINFDNAVSSRGSDVSLQ